MMSKNISKTGGMLSFLNYCHFTVDCQLHHILQIQSMDCTIEEPYDCTIESIIMYFHQFYLTSQIDVLNSH